MSRLKGVCIQAQILELTLKTHNYTQVGDLKHGESDMNLILYILYTYIIIFYFIIYIYIYMIPVKYLHELEVHTIYKAYLSAI